MRGRLGSRRDLQAEGFSGPARGAAAEGEPPADAPAQRLPQVAARLYAWWTSFVGFPPAREVPRRFSARHHQEMEANNAVRDSTLKAKRPPQPTRRQQDVNWEHNL
jgi:hypothetical protein